jgi:hypothetical protein
MVVWYNGIIKEWWNGIIKDWWNGRMEDYNSIIILFLILAKFKPPLLFRHH